MTKKTPPTFQWFCHLGFQFFQTIFHQPDKEIKHSKLDDDRNKKRKFIITVFKLRIESQGIRQTIK